MSHLSDIISNILRICIGVENQIYILKADFITNRISIL